MQEKAIFLSWTVLLLTLPVVVEDKPSLRCTYINRVEGCLALIIGQTAGLRENKRTRKKFQFLFFHFTINFYLKNFFFKKSISFSSTPQIQAEHLCFVDMISCFFFNTTQRAVWWKLSWLYPDENEVGIPCTCCSTVKAGVPWKASASVWAGHCQSHCSKQGTGPHSGPGLRHLL